MTRSKNAKGRLLRFEVLESRCFPSAVLPAVAVAPLPAPASNIASAIAAHISPAVRAAAGAVFISPAFTGPAATNAALNAPGGTGNLPDIVGSQGLFSPVAASADLTAEAAFPAPGGSLASAIAAVYGTQQTNLNTQGLLPLTSWLILNF